MARIRIFRIIKPASISNSLATRSTGSGRPSPCCWSLPYAPHQRLRHQESWPRVNWGVDFRGGTEIVVDFSKPVDAGAITRRAGGQGFDNPDVVKYGSAMERGSEQRVNI